MFSGHPLVVAVSVERMQIPAVRSGSSSLASYGERALEASQLDLPERGNCLEASQLDLPERGNCLGRSVGV